MSVVFVPLLSTLKHDCGKKLFFFDLPEVCVSCRKSLSNVPFVVVPSPFSCPLSFQCSILLKPTLGSFLLDYSFGANLHIGIADSNGFVTSFDREGLKKETFFEWSQSLSVLNCDSFSINPKFWDACFVDTTSLKDSWSKTKYEENVWNCFDFVLSFLKRLPKTNYLSDVSVFESKLQLVEQFVKPKLIRTTKFIEVYRRVLCNNGCVSI